MNVLQHNVPRQLYTCTQLKKAAQVQLKMTSGADAAMPHKMRPKMIALQTHAPRDAAADERHHECHHELR